jgi:hypothetical protein
MGMKKDGDEWIVGTQEKMVTYKDSYGKYHDKFVSVPTKMVEWEERHKTVQGVYEDAKERKLSADEIEKLLQPPVLSTTKSVFNFLAMISEKCVPFNESGLAAGAIKLAPHTTTGPIPVLSQLQR